MPKPRPDLIATRWSLIQRLQRWDDHEGWRQFFDTYWRLIHAAALKAGLRPDEAQEVVQETVISVCRGIAKFKGSPEAGSFKGWLLHMTRWRIADQFRKRTPGRPRQLPATSRTSTTARLPDPAGFDLEKTWEAEWQANLIQAALDRVQRQTNARHYQIFYLHVIRGAAVHQVAAATGVAPNDVYMIKHRLTPLFEKAVRAIEHNQP